MAITDQAIDQAFSDLKATCGGVRNDYFGLLYLMQEFGLERDIAIEQVAFGGNDYGVDGFHFDGEKRNLYLIQFKYSTSYEQFKPSFKRLTDFGMERIFGARTQDQHQNQLLQQIKSCLLENEAIVDRVCIHFVFTGDPTEAERSPVLDTLRENLEDKKYLIDQRFDRPVTMVIEFRSARTRKVGSAGQQISVRAALAQFVVGIALSGNPQRSEARRTCGKIRPRAQCRSSIYRLSLDPSHDPVSLYSCRFGSRQGLRS
jgi:hypothetical protein